MDVIKAARMLGSALQEDEAYKRLDNARIENDKNEELQQKIGEFNLKKMALSREMNSPEKSSDKISKLDKEMRDVYQVVMADKGMIEYSAAKSEIDEIMRKIEAILSLSLNGADPQTAEIPEKTACSGNCSDCGGCH